MFLRDLYKKVKFCITADRIGPDIPFTHWLLHFQSTKMAICKKKFLYFDDSADFRAGGYAVTCSQISLHRNVIIRPNTMLFADEFAKITIKNDVMIGSGVHFYVNNHRFDDTNVPIMNQGYYLSEDIVIESGVWIGANAIILPGVVIGHNSVIGAGSVVTKSVPSKVVFAGNPAKLIRAI